MPVSEIGTEVDDHRVFTLLFWRSDKRTRWVVGEPCHQEHHLTSSEISHYSHRLSGEEVEMQKTKLLRLMSAYIVLHIPKRKSWVKSWLDSNLRPPASQLYMIPTDASIGLLFWSLQTIKIQITCMLKSVSTTQLLFQKTARASIDPSILLFIYAN